jgi:hypothetical protein
MTTRSSSIDSYVAGEAVYLDCHDIGATCIDLGAMGGLQSHLDNSLYIVGYTASTNAAIDFILTPRAKL